MNWSRTDFNVEQALDQIIGYLNFSSGAEDAAFLSNLNQLFAYLDEPTAEGPLHEKVVASLRDRLGEIANGQSAFGDCNQARQVVNIVFDHVLPGYLQHHRDLLFQPDCNELFNSFFIGRTFEAVLRAGPVFSDAQSISRQSILRLNDYIGHRPVAALNNQKMEPYEHEWVRPIPLYIRSVGVAHGRYRGMIEQAIRVLGQTDASLAEAAQFDSQLLDELAVDPRAFDFDHPANKRPNHHFGQWDEHQIDSRGHYRRFVVHRVTLEALAARIEGNEIPHDQSELEAGAVLAGTILMASGICGRGPGAHASDVTLGNLLPGIAAYRDEFYERLLEQVDPAHRQRLVSEMQQKQQPFGGARQHLNSGLAEKRAQQLVYVNLALIFARMGYPDAAQRHANRVPVAAARMLCQIDCLLYAGRQHLGHGRLAEALQVVQDQYALIHRAIGCGAIIDPWNILGFDANYGLFPAVENSVRDHRADELVALMEQLQDFTSQIWIAAAADDHTALTEQVENQFDLMARWWRQFAAHEVSSVDATDPQQLFQASRDVATALNLWHKNGAQVGAIEFWARHARLFRSPRAYRLAAEALIARNDFATSMALLINWLSQADQIPLQQGSSSFHDLVLRWMTRQHQVLVSGDHPEFSGDLWNRLGKFYDYLEANADDYWAIPCFELGAESATGSPDTGPPAATAGEGEGEDLFGAAYEGMVYRDTTDDGVDGPIFDPAAQSDEQLHNEAQRIAEHLEFTRTLAQFWQMAVLCRGGGALAEASDNAESRGRTRRETIESWIRQAAQYSSDLQRLIGSVQAYEIPQKGGDHDSLADYDRHRLYKDSILDQAINVCVEVQKSLRFLSAWAASIDTGTERPAGEAQRQDEFQPVLASVLRGDAARVSQLFEPLSQQLEQQSLLYVPLSKGGEPLEIVEVRNRQCAIGELLECMPRMGLFAETRQLSELVLLMERNQTVRHGAVTEFDELFQMAYKSMVETLIDSAEELRQRLVAQSSADKEASRHKEANAQTDSALFDSLEMLTESMLLIWLSHSRTLRLSVLEKVADPTAWNHLVEFIQKYGGELFTQQFLNLSNIRAVLHQGVDRWLSQLAEHPSELPLQLIADLDKSYPRKLAVRHLTLVLEALIENFNEYRDYNCTTTASDRGELCYVLLDFLRLRSKYDRIGWHLRPVIWAHEVLVRKRQVSVARMWRRSLTERVAPEADKFLQRLKKLQQKYSVQMSSVAERLNERFVHPMQVDRLRSLVSTAMADPAEETSQGAFEMIEHQARSLAERPLGAGVDAPSWLTALDDEVERQRQIQCGDPVEQPLWLEQLAPIPIDQLREQIESLPGRHGE